MARSSAEITAQRVELSQLLDGIAEGSVVLPDFQRDFVWSEGDIASLVATVMMGWPAGSLLLMRGAPEFFETREFEGAPSKAPVTQYVVLDGQQRLTALFHALRDGGGDARYVLDLDKLDKIRRSSIGEVLSAEELEEAIEVFDVRDLDRRLRPSASGPLLVPFSALASASAFFEWRDYASSQAPPGLQDSVRTRLADAYREFLGTVNHFQFPVVIMENDLPTEAVARIFERINKGGQELSTFDLLVARAYSPDWNLRLEWDRAQRETDLIEIYLRDEGLPVLQALALREFADVRRPALLKLNPPTIQREWDASVEAMEKAAEFVERSGMRSRPWVPYQQLLVPLAALALAHDLEAWRPLLESWLWARSLQMDYDVASSTKMSADFATLSDAIALHEPLTFKVSLDPLLEATRRQQGALWRTFLSLMLRNQAVDPFTGAAMAPEAESSPSAVVTPLVPRNPSEPKATLHLRVLSQMLLERGGGKRFRNRSMLAALGEATQTDPATVERLKSQFLVLDESSAWDPEGTLAKRFGLARSYVQREFPLIQLVEAPPDETPT
jgi:hypothetical protein